MIQQLLNILEESNMFRFIFYVFIALSTISCSTALKVDLVAEEFRQDSLTYFVENHGSDERGLDRAIALELNDRGYNASYGTKRDRPEDVDILVAYEDRWQWDMSNYLIHMRIDLRSPETNILLGTGSSYQTSLARKPVNDVIKNIMSGMFDSK